jgi:Uma2 family endonuclease
MTDQSVSRIEELLAIRPITEAVAAEVKSTPGYEHLEILNGEWIGFERDEMTTGEEHGWIEALLIILLGGYVLTQHLGRLYPGNVTFVLDGTPDDIRVQREPDVAFVAATHVTPTSGFIYRAPDLAIEIISPSQSYTEMTDKIDEYFQFGTQQVWLVPPSRKQIEVHYPDQKPRKYKVGETISGGDLLPGFTVNVAAVFDNKS